MPKETFWDSSTAIEGDGTEPILTVRWGGEAPSVTLNDVQFDRAGINRLVDALVRARNATFGADADGNRRTVKVAITADTTEWDAALKRMRADIEHTKNLRGSL